MGGAGGDGSSGGGAGGVGTLGVAQQPVAVHVPWTATHTAGVARPHSQTPLLRQPPGVELRAAEEFWRGAGNAGGAGGDEEHWMPQASVGVPGPAQGRAIVHTQLLMMVW